MPIGWRLAELEPFVPSDGGTDSWARAEIAAGLLGRVHGALAGWEAPVPVVPPRVHASLPDRTLRRWLDRTRHVVSTRTAHPRRGAALAALTAAGSLLTGIGAVPPPDLPRQLTHGDYGHDNLRFRGDTPVALLDLDFAAVRPRVADLSDLAFGPHWLPSFGQLGRSPEDRDWLRVGDLTRRYDETANRPLSGQEIAALPGLMARLPVAWAAMGWLMADPVGAVADLGEEIDTAAWILGHREDLVAGWQP